MDIFKSKYFKWGLTAFLVVVASTIFYFLVFNLGAILGFLSKIIKVLTSLVIGLVIAYILHPIVNFFENKIYKKVKNKNKKRNLAIATTVAIVFIVLTTIISIIIPQLLTSIISLINNSDAYVNELSEFVKKVLSNGDNAEKYSAMINDFVISLKSNVLPFAQTSLTKISSGIIGAFTGFLNLLIGIVFAVYILANTSNFGAGIRKTLYAFFNVDKVNKFIDNVEHVNTIFLRFMVGKVTDSSIVCLCTFLFLIICRFPYAVLIAVIIGLTDLIPYFGPYIGTIPSALLLCVVDPLMALIFIAFIICLQQIDANLITPRIQSSATGLPSFWVLFAITLFGGFFGLVGLLIGVPCFTIIYEIVKNFISDRLEEKKLPVDTDYYENHELEIDSKGKIKGVE